MPKTLFFRNPSFFDNVATLSVSGDVPESQLRYWALLIRDELIDAGIDKVTLTGLRAPEVQIDISERQNAQFGITPSGLSQTIRQSNPRCTVSNLDGIVEKQVRALSMSNDLEALRGIEKFGSNSTGQKLELRDVATITRGTMKTVLRAVLVGSKAIEIDVQKVGNSRYVRNGRNFYKLSQNTRS